MYKPIFVRITGELKKINPEDIVGLSTEKNYTKILMADNTPYLVRSTLSNVLKKLPPGIFVKVHRCYAVSILFVDKVFRDHLVLREEPVPIGKQYYKSVIAQLTVIE